VATHELRRLELDLDVGKVALATSEGEFTTAHMATAVAQTRITGKGFFHLDAWMKSRVADLRVVLLSALEERLAVSRHEEEVARL